MGLPDSESITVGEVELLSDTKQRIEYAVSTEDNADPESLVWQTLTTFHGLSTGTAYYVYARSVKNGYYNAGDASVSDLIRFYTVDFNANGAAGGEVPKSQTVLENTFITLPDWWAHTSNALWRTASAFGSWNTMQNGTGTNFIPGSHYEVTHDQTMFVIWLDAQTYELPYDAPSGGGILDSGIYISQTATGLHPVTGQLLPLYGTMNVPASYVDPKWSYGGTPLDQYTSNGGFTLTVDARNILYNVLGLHVIHLEVWQADNNGVLKPYSFEITFMVEF